MNKLALTWAAIKGALNPFGSIFDSVTAYVLGRVNDALNAIDVGRREKIQAALNVACRILVSRKSRETSSISCRETKKGA